jgi:hypothetical protein
MTSAALYGWGDVPVLPVHFHSQWQLVYHLAERERQIDHPESAWRNMAQNRSRLLILAHVSESHGPTSLDGAAGKWII